MDLILNGMEAPQKFHGYNEEKHSKKVYFKFP